MLGNSGFPTINDIIDVGSFAGRAVFFYGLLHRKHSLNTYVVASGYTSVWIDQTRTSNRLGTTGIRLRPFFFFYVPKCGPRLSLRHSLWFEISWKYPTEEHTSLKKKYRTESEQVSKKFLRIFHSLWLADERCPRAGEPRNYLFQHLFARLWPWSQADLFPRSRPCLSPPTSNPNPGYPWMDLAASKTAKAAVICLRRNFL